MSLAEEHGLLLLLQLQWDFEARVKIHWGRSEPTDIYGNFTMYEFKILSEVPWKLLAVTQCFQSY